MEKAVSKRERLVAERLHTVFAAVAADAAVEESAARRKLLSALEFYVGDLLTNYCSGWPTHESLDGIIPSIVRFVGADELELIGTCILISTQHETPIHIRMQAHPDGDELATFSCRVGAPDPETGALGLGGYGSARNERLRMMLPAQLDSVAWMYTITIGSELEATSRTTKRCDECESLYFRETSAMSALCPECAHRRYGYDRCGHDFRGDRCVQCFWDGSSSEHLDD